MTSTTIKICGITRLEDGLAAVDSGADWLGFIRWPGSKRFRPLDECAALIKALRAGSPRPFHAVAVYVDAPAESILDEVERAGFDRIQLHGAESFEFARLLPVPVIKTIKIRSDASLKHADDYPTLDLLTDTDDPFHPGGTGRRYDPELLRDLAGRRRLMVAGGLNPGNVAAVVCALRPMGVDVSSGVETEPGIKDADRMRAFIKAVRDADARVADERGADAGG